MKRKISLILVIVWMVFIFIMSSFSANESSMQSGFIVNIISNILNIKNVSLLTSIVRNMAHFTEFLILGVLVYNYLYHSNKAIIYSVVFCMVYAISDELHQILVPGRCFQIEDILIDIFGSIIGITILNICKHKFDK